MIYARPGAEFSAILEDTEKGLVGVLAITITDMAGAVEQARSKTGIVELPTAPGNYVGSRIAPTDDGNYVLAWDKDADGLDLDPLDVAVEQLQVTRTAPYDSVVAFLPDPSDVAAVLRARTFNNESAEVGTFTTETRPTEGQVTTLINQAGNEVGARLGQEIEDDGLRAYARELVAIRAAMGVELSYYPEQTNAEDSIYENLRELYETGLVSLIQSLPDTSSTVKGLYSIRMRSEAADYFETGELLP